MERSQATPGTRVKVSIADFDTYAMGCAKILDGQTGVIEATAHEHTEKHVLVRFDKALPSWWSHGSPVTAFWFPAAELVAL